MLEHIYTRHVTHHVYCIVYCSLQELIVLYVVQTLVHLACTVL